MQKIPTRGPARTDHMLQLFLCGHDYKEIARLLGISVQGVRQALYRSDGFKDKRALKKYGCTDRQLHSFSAEIRYRFCKHRIRAKRLKIEFKLSLPEWWEIWRASGRFEQRGVYNGQYVMCRKGDVGPYAVDNVYIALSAENVATRPTKRALPRGVEQRKGKFVARLMRRGKNINLGVFESVEEAAASYRAARQIY